MKPGWEANWDIMKAVLDDKTYKELRMHTTHDEFNAALATKTITEGIVDLLTPWSFTLDAISFPSF